MGLFATFVYSDGQWGGQASASAWLSARIHDSDFVEIGFAPGPGGADGLCYVGFEPRHYFEDPTASEPVDVEVQAAALAEWSHHVSGTHVEASTLVGLLASPEGEEAPDVFVEAALVRLLRTLGLPIPEDLEDWG